MEPSISITALVLGFEEGGVGTETEGTGTSPCKVLAYI